MTRLNVQPGAPRTARNCERSGATSRRPTNDQAGHIELWSLAEMSPAEPVQRETLQEQPSAAAFTGARTLIVGTRRGRMLRFELV